MRLHRADARRGRRRVLQVSDTVCFRAPPFGCSSESYMHDPAGFRERRGNTPIPVKPGADASSTNTTLFSAAELLQHSPQPGYSSAASRGLHRLLTNVLNLHFTESC